MKAKVFITVLCLLSLTACQNKGNQTNAICGGKQALIDFYQCDLGPIGSGGYCILVGYDRNGDNKWSSADNNFTIDDGSKHSVTYDQVKNLSNIKNNTFKQCSG